MKNLTLKEKRANELEALNNALNYHKKDIPEFENATIVVREENKKRPYSLSFPKSFLTGSGELNYMEMNVFIRGYAAKSSNVNTAEIIARQKDETNVFTFTKQERNVIIRALEIAEEQVSKTRLSITSEMTNILKENYSTQIEESVSLLLSLEDRFFDLKNKL